MFSQKKSFFKGKLFYMILIGLFIFGYWLNQSSMVLDLPNDVSTDSDYPAGTSAVKDKDTKSADNYDIMDNIVGGANLPTNEAIGKVEESDAENETEENAVKSYYLVKEIDGLVNIFYYDEQGKETLIRATDIAFSLLSEADQALFKKGVIKHSLDELDELLQDFES